MITEEHLNHWMNEIAYALEGMKKEVSPTKLKGKTGVSIAVSPNQNEDVFVSFEYLQEKITTINSLLKCIEDDIAND
jgi:hypothetical protein